MRLAKERGEVGRQRVDELLPFGRRVAACLERIELFPVRYPMAGYFKFFTGPHGDGRPAVLVKVTDTDGFVGFGQSVPIAIECP